MNIYIYSDESGVFDSKNADYFVFGGIICFGQEQKEIASRKYSHVESTIKDHKSNKCSEIKASNVTNAQKGKLYRSLNSLFKFCVVIRLKQVDSNVFENKKHKQRYMDFAYKMVLKKCFVTLIKNKIINPKEVDSVIVCADEHTTSTDGLYELRENLLREFKIGTFNMSYQHFFEPIFPSLKNLNVEYCNSRSKILIRAADIVANHAYHNVLKNDGYIKDIKDTFVLYMPINRIGGTGLNFFACKE